ncbi:MAG: hypothetical protein KC657_05840 [Myxococcales bacterium]|nr:hypothetical protein [Myxococcales bacterium]
MGQGSVYALAALVTVAGACSPFSSASEPDAGASTPDGAAPAADGGLLVDGGPRPAVPCGTFCDDFERGAPDVKGPWTTLEEKNGKLSLVPSSTGGTALLVTTEPFGPGVGASRVALHTAVAPPKKTVSIRFRVMVKSVGAWAANATHQLFKIDLGSGDAARRLSIDLEGVYVRMQERVGVDPNASYKQAVVLGTFSIGTWHEVDAAIDLQEGVAGISGQLDGAPRNQGPFTFGAAPAAAISLGEHYTENTPTEVVFDQFRVQID